MSLIQIGDCAMDWRCRANFISCGDVGTPNSTAANSSKELPVIL